MIYVGHHICRTREERKNRNYALREKIAQFDYLTFDEAYLSVWENRDLLKGKKFIIFVAGDYIGKDNGFDKKGLREKICTWEQIKDLEDMGGLIGWHTWSHPPLKRISPEQLKKELKSPFKTDYFSYPYGRFNRVVTNAVKEAGYKYAFSVNRGDNTRFQLLRKYL